MSPTAEDGRNAAVRLATVAGLVLLAHVIDAHWQPAAARVVVAAVVFAALILKRDLLRSRWPWVVMTLALGWVLYTIPYRLGNHHYVLCYTGLAMILCNGADDRRFLEDFGTNLRWFLVAIMSIAVLQRMISPTFVDGSYLALLISRGELFGFVWVLCDSCREVVESNRGAVARFLATDPSLGGSITLEPPTAHLGLFARGFAVFILVIELWIAAAFAFFKKPWIRHTALLPFVIALGFTRSEFVFASVLALVGLGTCSLEEKRMRNVYALLAVILTACVFLFPVETGSFDPGP